MSYQDRKAYQAQRVAGEPGNSKNDYLKSQVEHVKEGNCKISL
jgi:hypothetical protein